LSRARSWAIFKIVQGVFAVWMERLGKGTYRWPAPDATHVGWTAAELAAALGGIDLGQARRRPPFAPAAPEDSRQIVRTSDHASSTIPV
jgi:hypothetical protein